MFVDGQAPNPGFQQYYPLASRNLYGQPNPQAPPQPIPQAKPSPAAAHSPYGGPSPYQSSAYDDQSSLGGASRYGESKGAGQQTQQQAAPQSYQSQAGGLHNFLGMNTPSATGSGASRQQASTPDDSFKSQTTGSTGAQAGQGNGLQGGLNRQNPQQGLAGHQQQQHGAFNYPYGAAGGYGNQDWAQYGQQQHQYGSRNGYSHWQQ